MREETLYPAALTQSVSSSDPEVGSDAERALIESLSAIVDSALRAGRVITAAQASLPSGPRERRPLGPEVLQEIVLDSPLVGQAFCFTAIEPPVMMGSEESLILAAGSRITFNTYLNSFYEHYWISHTPMRRLALTFFGTGQVLVEWFRVMSDGVTRPIGRSRLDLDEQGITTSVDLAATSASAGRIYFRLQALSRQVVLRAARLETDTKVERPVSLGLGLCTFNREAALAANLERILASPYYSWGKPTITVVNQGRRFSLPPLTQLIAENPQIQVIEQPNFGGVGGFTRAAMELSRSGNSTHVLFMDDDIEIDPRVLVTTHAFAARTSKPTVIGGAMLDLFRPSIMYEAGAVVGSDNILRAALHGRQLDREVGLQDLAREVEVHFNGWWYCAIPTEVFTSHGLPLPIFIRGDDMEYGVRLWKRGIPTVSLPPVGVWHEPFYAKPPGWQLYYDLRNRLIFASCYPDLVQLDSPGIILRRLVDSLLKHDYLHAELILHAVTDFLEGPATLDVPMDRKHADISAVARSLGPERVTSSLGMLPVPPRNPARGFMRPVTLMFGMARLLLGKARPALRPDLVFTDQWHPWLTMGVSRYALADRNQSFIQVYAFDRARLRNGFRRGLALVQRFRKEAGPISAAWRAAHPSLTSWERWDRVLGTAVEGAAILVGEASKVETRREAETASDQRKPAIV